jgi:hypothetical protein
MRGREIWTTVLPVRVSRFRVMIMTGIMGAEPTPGAASGQTSSLIGFGVSILANWAVLPLSGLKPKR